MTVWAKTETGERLLLGAPAQAVLSRDADAPADLLRLRFPAEQRWESLAELAVFEEDRTLFRGVVDEQNTVLGTNGLSVELICRSREAILLDNEAPPGSLLSPSLELLELRLLNPLGLLLGEGDRSPQPGELTVEKGASCWTVLSSYCRARFGLTPWVDDLGLVQCVHPAEETLELSEFLSAQLSQRPCKRITEVWQQSCRGGYDTPYRSGTGGRLRRRYLSAQSGRDPKALLRESAADSLLLTVSVPGAVLPGRGAKITATVPGLGRFADCALRSAQLRLEESGCRTALVLEPGEGGEAPCG